MRGIKTQEPTGKKAPFSLGKALLAIVAAVFIFQLGMGIGSGRFALGRTDVQSRNTSLPSDLSYDTVEQVYDALRESYDGELTEEQLLDGLKQGLAKSTGDPFTEYLNPSSAQEFNNDLNGTFTGIGAELSKDNEAIVIVSPIAGFPAEKAGLRSRDVIVEIDGQSAYDLTITEAVKRIRGEAGTKVQLKVVRNGSEALTFDITREQITIPSVTSEILDGNIGYLKIARYADDTAALASEAADRFKAANVNGVILDVRGNPGGLLDSSIKVSGIWLPKGTTVLEEKRDDVVVKTYASEGRAQLQGVPTIVLIDGGSASASEITAGALKDNNAATLLGEKSYGKGSVQTLQPLRNGGVLKVTIARWFTPAGKNIDKEGIEPDQKVERTEEDFKNERDPQKDAAIEKLRQR